MRIVRVSCSNSNCNQMVRIAELKVGEEVPKDEKCDRCRRQEQTERLYRRIQGDSQRY